MHSALRNRVFRPCKYQVQNAVDWFTSARPGIARIGHSSLAHDAAILFVNLLIGLLGQSVLSRFDLLNPLLAPIRCLERIREILCFVPNLSFTELHDAHCVC
jgi:hypothetical protein